MSTVLETSTERTHLDDDSLYEIVHGERREKPPMGVPQNLVCAALSFYLGPYVREQHLGTVVPETLFVLDQASDLQRRPDLAFVSRQRWRRPEQTHAWDVIPDLMVEVISPTNRADDVIGKIEEYFAAGVRLVWVVYCEQRKIYVYQSPEKIRVLGPGAVLEGEDVVSGFNLPVAKLFEELDEPAEGRDA